MEDWNIKWDVVKWINQQIDWLVIHGDALFSGIRDGILIGILSPLRKFLLWLPWWLVIIGTGFLAWRVVDRRIAIMVVVFLGLMGILGMHDLAMTTLAVVLTATLLCVALGIPIGIVAAKSNRFDSISRPILDGMQTMPSFVYLVPALMLFGLGMVPAVLATCIYAIPPMIRLTNLGIRQVDTQILEASKSFGTTTWQLLTKVQIPLAIPTILAGVNQTIMMALAMVVLASMIGAAGLGVEVLTGLGRINPGQAFVGGISIVFLAIILDRISQGFAKRPGKRPAT
ncbi:MAG: proline/glycine betaine ABC transporter permease [Dehalococcoidales bacterium]|nr:proline/glycine betaine ABC transporter permease [Dehalococcoidales bacterium]